LQERGLTMKAASKEAGRGETFVRDILERDRVPSVENLTRLAGVLGVTAADLLGQAAEPAATVPLVGDVGAGAEAHYYAEAQGPFAMVRAPEGATQSTVAVEVRGESLGPLFDRWLVFYDEVRSPVTPDLIGRLCV